MSIDVNPALLCAICRNIVACHGLVHLDPNHAGLPRGYEHPCWGIVLELCKVIGILAGLIPPLYSGFISHDLMDTSCC